MDESACGVGRTDTNKVPPVSIAELEAEHGKPPKTPDNSSLPPSIQPSIESAQR
jgi:hypothetical protein